MWAGKPRESRRPAAPPVRQACTRRRIVDDETGNQTTAQWHDRRPLGAVGAVGAVGRL